MIYIGADHRGYALKDTLLSWLKEQGHAVEDCSHPTLDPNDDYPDVAFAVGERVTHDLEGKGIVICGSGAGVCIASNKVPLVRCAQAITVSQVKSARADDDVNVLALGSDLISLDQAKEFISTFLETEYAAEIRFDRRIQKIVQYEQLMAGGGSGCCGGGCC